MSKTTMNKTAETRKTDKTEGFLDKAKRFIKKHKVEIAIGAGLVAAYAITKKPKAAAKIATDTVQALPSPTVINPETIGTVAEVATDISNVAAPVVETVSEVAPAVVETVNEVM